MTDPLCIGVLLCDHIDPELRAVAGGDYDTVFGTFLATAANDIDVAIDVKFYDAVGGELPLGPDECDAWLVTGSRHNAFADEEWIASLEAFVREVVEQRGRVVGICFGHQVIAAALGGTVERTGRWAVGPQRMQLDATPWFDAMDVAIHAMHQDAITALPDGAQTIGVGTTADVPAYLIGDNVFCVQDHPEYTAAFIRALMESRTDRIDGPTVTAARTAIQAQPTDGATVGGAVVAFLADRRLQS